MKKIRFIIVIIIVISCKAENKVNVQFTLSKYFEQCHFDYRQPYKIFSDKKSFLSFLDEKFPNQCDEIIAESETFDFEKNDLLLTFRGDVKSVYYLKDYNGKYDLCPELKKIPIQIEFDEKGNKIGILKLEEKNSYRTPCP